MSLSQAGVLYPGAGMEAALGPAAASRARPAKRAAGGDGPSGSSSQGDALQKCCVLGAVTALRAS